MSFRFGPYRLDPAKRVLWRGHELVPLPPKSLDLLLALVEQQGDVVTKEELMQRVWPDTFVEEANLSVNISSLRKALGAQTDGRPYIQTVPRRGYRFLAATEREGLLSSLAVLPFQPLGPGHDEDYLGIGMADALITRLGGTGKVLVRPTSAILQYAASSPDPRQAGRDLKVDAVLDGRIQRQGDRLRVTVQLVPVAGTVPPWSGKFEAEFKSLFSVQDAISDQVARALALELDEAGRRRLGKRHTEVIEAFQAYTKGRYFWSRLSGPWLEKALACFQEAAERDPDYALPHAGLADFYMVLGFSGLIPPPEAWTLAAAAAEKALALDDALVEARVSLGYVKLFQGWNWETARSELERALTSDPNSAAAHQWYGLYLDMRGDFDQAAHEVARACELDPVSLIASTMMALQFNLTRQHEREIRQALKTVELDPNHFLGHWALGLAYAHQGRCEEALAHHQRALDLSLGSAFVKAVRGWTLAAAGRHDDARAVLGELEQLSPHSYVSPYQRATILAVLGERQRAFECLEEACAARDPWVVWLKVDPMLDGLRSHRRFAELLRRVFPVERAP